MKNFSKIWFFCKKVLNLSLRECKSWRTCESWRSKIQNSRLEKRGKALAPCKVGFATFKLSLWLTPRKWRTTKSPLTFASAFHASQPAGCGEGLGVGILRSKNVLAKSVARNKTHKFKAFCYKFNDFL